MCITVKKDYDIFISIKKTSDIFFPYPFCVKNISLAAAGLR
jgi:hypothetical protein